MQDVLSVVVGAAGAGGIAIWAFKMWVSRVNKRFDQQDLVLLAMQETMTNIRLQLAKQEGEQEGKEKLVWREINTGKIKAEKALSSTDKLWVAMRLIGSKIGVNVDRTSDSIENMIEDSMNKK